MSTLADQFYIDDTTGNFYLHETGAWVLKGNLGANGGHGAPVAGMNSLYVDVDSGNVYFAGSGIGTLGGGTSTQGPQGQFIVGDDGADGEDSFVPGPQGAAGAVGAQGISGNQGPQGQFIVGDDGADGEDSFVPGPQGPTGAAPAAICAGMWCSTAQAITPSAHTLVALDTSLFTSNGITVDLTNHQFTIVTAGLYLLCAQVFANLTGTFAQCAIEFYVNGATVSTALNESPAPGSNSTVASVMTRLNVGDVVQMYVYIAGGPGISLVNQSIYTFMSLASLGH